MSQEKEKMEVINKPVEQYNCVIVDTINAVQNDLYMSMLDRNEMVTRDKWRDFGTDIYMLMDDVKKLKNTEIVLVLGYEGSGKSFGIKGLDPNTTMWLHTDKKGITFKGGRQNYKKEFKNYFDTELINYDEVAKYIKGCHTKRIQTKPFVVFILGHIEDYKVETQTRQRLKVLGNLATKMNIEGSVTHCYYTYVNKTHNSVEYKLRTVNTGFNTGRSLEGMFKEELIDNNFQLILDGINNY
jgi:hypothetical protein